MRLTYNSPIKLIYDKMTMNIEDEIVTVVQRVNINVDKEELIKALEYDRGQYEKGYADAMADAIPVEWLKERYKTEGYYGTDEYFRKAHAVKEIIADWQAEQRREE